MHKALLTTAWVLEGSSYKTVLQFWPKLLNLFRHPIKFCSWSKNGVEVREQFNPLGSNDMMVWHGFTSVVCTSNKYQTSLLFILPFPFLKFDMNTSNHYVLKYFRVQQHMKSFDQMPLCSYKDLSFLFHVLRNRNAARIVGQSVSVWKSRCFI